MNNIPQRFYNNKQRHEVRRRRGRAVTPRLHNLHLPLHRYDDLANFLQARRDYHFRTPLPAPNYNFGMTVTSLMDILVPIVFWQSKAKSAVACLNG